MALNNQTCSCVSKDLDGVLQNIRHRFNVPGVSLGIVNNGSAILSKGFGKRNINSECDNVTNTTRFCIGSITKSFTATILAQIIGEHRGISWDTPLKELLGDEFAFGDSFRTERACLRDLLAHKVGIELGETDFGWLCGAVDRSSLVKNVQHMPLAADFRTKLQYNNFLYGLAACVAEKVTEKSWEDLVKERLFEPLGMTESGFIDKEGPGFKDIAQPYMNAEGKLTPIHFDVHRCVECCGPCGSICASADDMVKYMLFHLNTGSVDGVQLVKPILLKECYKPQFALPNGKPEWDGYASLPTFPVTETRDTYGLGWYMGTYRGFKMVAHSGELFGFDALLTMFPDKKIGIYSCFNGPGGEASFIGNQILHYFISDFLLGYEPWINPDTVSTFPEPWLQKVAYFPERVHIPWNKGENEPSRHLTFYSGTYKHGFLGEITVYIKNNRLFLKIGRIAQFSLEPNGENDQFRMIGIGKIDFLHKLDLYSPTEWMMIQFVFKGQASHPEGLYCSLFETSPFFVREL